MKETMPGCWETTHFKNGIEGSYAVVVLFLFVLVLACIKNSNYWIQILNWNYYMGKQILVFN